MAFFDYETKEKPKRTFSGQSVFASEFKKDEMSKKYRDAGRAIVQKRLEGYRHPDIYTQGMTDDDYVAIGKKDAKEKEPGVIKAGVAAVARGIPALGELAGHAIKTLDPEGGIDVVEKVGQKIIDVSEGMRDVGIMKPAVPGVEEEGFVRRGIMGGLESTIPSLAPLGVGVGAGALAGSVFGPPGTVIGGLVGGIGATLGIHGLGVYGQKKEEYVQQGIDEKTAHGAAIKQGIIEGGIETVSNLIGMVTFGWGKLAAQPLKTTAKELLKTPVKTFAKNLTKNALLNEVPTEMIQGALGAKVDEEIGLLPEGAWQEAAVESIIPALTMSVLFGVGAQGITSLQRNSVKNQLNSENPEERKKAAEYIAKNIDDKELRQSWADMVEPLIDSGVPIDINADFTQTTSEETGIFRDAVESGQLAEDIKSGEVTIDDMAPVIEKIATQDPALATQITEMFVAEEVEPVEKPISAARDTLLDEGEKGITAKELLTGKALTSEERIKEAAEVFEEAPRRPAEISAEVFEEKITEEKRIKAKAEIEPDINKFLIRGYKPEKIAIPVEVDKEGKGLKTTPDQKRLLKGMTVEEAQTAATQWNDLIEPGMRDVERKARIAEAETLVKERPDLFNLVHGRLNVEDPAKIEAQVREVDASPTEAQIEAGNYKKAHIKVQGFDISIENPEGSKRSGVSPEGKKWSITMSGGHYGYFKRSAGKDGEQIDVFVNAGERKEGDRAYIVDQIDPETGKFDEHKAMVGYPSLEAASEGYLANYEKGWKGLGDITEVSMDDLKTFVEKRQTRPYSKIKKPAVDVEPEIKKPTKIERRKDIARRKLISEMSQEELRAELLINPVTRIPNKRAYQEAEAVDLEKGITKPKAYIDVDSLKYVNDFAGHAAGDELLQTVAKAASEVTPDSYHISGDEFIIRAKTEKEAEALADKLNEKLSGAELEFTNDKGEKYTYKGLGVSYGVHREETEADRLLRKHKEEREAEGLRARRGERPPGLREVDTGEGRRREGEIAEKEIAKLAKPIAPDVAKPKPPEAVREEIEAKPIPEVAPKIEKKKIKAIPEKKEKIKLAPVKKAKIIKPVVPGVKPKVKKEKIEVTPEKEKPVEPKAKESIKVYVDDYVKFENSGGQVFYGDVVKVHKDADTVDILPDGASNPIEMPANMVTGLERGGRYRKRAMVEIKTEEPKVIEEKIEVAPTPEGKEITIDLTKKEEAAVTPKQQKTYLLTEIDKAIEGSLKEAEVESVERARELLKMRINPLQQIDTVFKFEVPNDGTFEIIGSELFDFQKRVESAFPSTIISKKFKPKAPAKKAVPEAKYKKILDVAPEKLKPEDIDRIFEEVADTEVRDLTGAVLLNPFQNWLLSQDISEAVRNKIKSVADKDYIAEAVEKMESQDIEYARVMVQHTHDEMGELQAYYDEHKAGKTTLKEIAEETGIKRSGNQMEQDLLDATDAYAKAAKHFEELTEIKPLFLIRKPYPLVSEASVASELQGHINKITARWKNAPIVEVVQSQSELPKEILKYSEGQIVDGVYFRGKVYIVADNQASPEDAVKTLLHESFGHFGLRAVLGKEFGDIMDKVYSAKEPAIQTIADSYGFDTATYKGRVLAAEEWLSREAVTNPESNWVNKVVAVIRRFMRKIMPSLKMADAELCQLIYDARSYVEIGKPGTGVGIDRALRVPGYQAIKQAERFYSQVIKTVQDKMPAKMQASAVMPWLRKQPGIKAAELEWMDVEAMLEGKKVVVRDELVGLLRENQVVVEEVVKSGDVFYTEEDLDYQGVEKQGNVSFHIFNVPGNVLQLPVSKYKTEKEARDYALTKIKKYDTTKFAQYQLPGEKENYRELLFTLPGKKPLLSKKEYSEYAKLNSYVRQGDKKLTVAELARYEYLKNRYEQIEKEGDAGFVSPHWDEPNVFAHVRTNERTDADGNKILFIEELQSDFALEGRKKGYRGILPAEWTIQEFIPELGENKWEVLNENGIQQFAAPTKREALDGATREAVPDIPFKKNWHEVVLKRIIRMAAEQGMDKVSWVTGQQTADRYDLSKHLESVTILYTKKSGYRIDAFDYDGEKVIAKSNLSVDELQGHVGKDLTDKALSKFGDDDKGTAIFSGLDLKTGGVWTYALYDRMIPQYLKKFGKKDGAEVGATEIDTTGWQSKREYIGDDYTIEDVKKSLVVAKKDGPSVFESPITGERQMFAVNRVQVANELKSLQKEIESGTSFSNAVAMQSNAVAELFGGKIERVSETTTQQSFTITPALKRAALVEGMPLFAKEKPPTDYKELLKKYKAPVKAPIEKPLPADEDVIKTYKEKHIAFEPKKLQLTKQVAKDFIAKVYTKFVFAEFPAIRLAAKAKDPKVIQRIQDQINKVWGKGGIVEVFVAGKGPHRYDEGGKPEYIEGSQSLKEIVKDLSPQEYEDYETLRIAERDIALATFRPDIKGTDIEASSQVVKALEKKYGDNIKKLRDVSKEQRKYDDTLLKLLVEEGWLSKKVYDGIKAKPESEFYASFLREMDTVGEQVHGGKDPLKKIKGSELRKIPTIESSVSNTYKTIKLLETIKLNKKIVELKDLTPDLAEVIEEVQPQYLTKDVPERPGPRGGTKVSIRSPIQPKGTIIVPVDGVKHYWRVPPDVHKAIDYYSPQEMSMAIKILSGPAKLLRAGATLTAEFIMRNPVRDQFSAMVYSKYGYIPFIDFGKGFFELMKKGDLYQEFKAGGGEQSYFTSMDRTTLNLTARDILGFKKGLKTYNPIEYLRIASEVMEKSTRLGVFKRAKDKGATTSEATAAARESTLDFRRIGEERRINQITAFWNANVQGTDILRRKLQKHPGRTLLRLVLGITIPSIALWLFNNSDDERKERYNSLPGWRKNFFWNIVIDKDMPIISLPKPFELGLIFGSLPERIFDYIVLNDPKELETIAHSIVEGVVPGVIPTLPLALIENMTNWSFFMKRPIESETIKRLPPGQRAHQYTSSVLREIGKVTNLSPLKMENWVRGWSGGLGKLGLDIIDPLFETGDVPEVTKDWYRVMPGIRGFISREPIGSAGKDITNFYDNLQRANEAEQGFKVLIKTDRDEAIKFDEKTKGVKVFAKIFRKQSLALGKLRKRKAVVMGSKALSSDKKRDLIETIDTRMSFIAKTQNERFRKFLVAD